MIDAAGPEAVALRARFTDVERAEQALGDYIGDRPEIASDPQLSRLADEAQNALANLRVAITTKLRKLCGITDAAVAAAPGPDSFPFKDGPSGPGGWQT